MKTVITYGTFDLFHYGHARLLKRLKDLGDHLVVGCSSDEFNLIKGKKTVIPYAYREEVLMSCKYVDHVFPENNWDQKFDDIKKYNANIFAMGDDWIGKFDFLVDAVDVVYLPRTTDVSTTDIKQLVNSMNFEKMREISALADKISNLTRLAK